MAQVDVTELLSDPDFVDKIQLVNRKAQTNGLGENVVIEEIVNTIGSVQPASGKTLARLPEALRVGDVSSFWVKAEIIASAPGKYTSQLTFRGRRYNVQTVLDWANFGAGWCEGTCIVQVPS